MRDREAFLQELYTPFVPLWADLWDEEAGEDSEEDDGWSKQVGFQPSEGGKVAPIIAGEEGREQEGAEDEVVGEGGGEHDDFDHPKQEGDGVTSVAITCTGSVKQKPTMWWRGADAPHIWKGPPTPKAAAAAAKCRRVGGGANGKLTPGARFVPAERALLDYLEPQTMSVGRLSREYLSLLGLPYESVRDMFEKVRAAFVLCFVRVSSRVSF